MIIAAFKNGEKTVYTKTVHQFDKGQRLIVTGIALPSTFEVHVSNDKEDGMAYSCEGTAEGIMIPDAFFVSGEYIYVWLYATDVIEEPGETIGYKEGSDETITAVDVDGKTIYEGETIYTIVIPVARRSISLPVASSGGTGRHGYIVDENETLVMVTN